MMRRCSSNPEQWCNCVENKPCPTYFINAIPVIEAELKQLNEKINIINAKIEALESYDKIREGLRG
jgi:type I site-specific restriction-modification system R (restriction) subunit